MNDLAKYLFLLLIFVVVCFTGKMAFAADPGDDPATCAISVTVSTIVEWDGDFPAINLDDHATDGPIAAQGHIPDGTAAFTLWTNANITISSDQTTASQLYHQRSGGAEEDTLVTKYQIATDEAGVTATGATASAISASSADTWIDYDSFLATPLAITHFNTDGAVEVTLSVQASNDNDNVADSGAYSCTQTITTLWVSDN